MLRHVSKIDVDFFKDIYVLSSKKVIYGIIFTNTLRWSTEGQVESPYVILLPRYIDNTSICHLGLTYSLQTSYLRWKLSSLV